MEIHHNLTHWLKWLSGMIRVKTRQASLDKEMLKCIHNTLIRIRNTLTNNYFCRII